MNRKLKAVLVWIVFLILNFGALAIGGYFTGSEVKAEWYMSLNKAPWTPPGWVFGAAWTTIMICFSFYMTSLVNKHTQKTKVVFVYIIQWILNVLWNPVFFYFHHVTAAFIIITALTLLITYMLFFNWKFVKLKTFFIVPYFLWMIIATSLNFYILIRN